MPGTKIVLQFEKVKSMKQLSKCATAKQIKIKFMGADTKFCNEKLQISFLMVSLTLEKA